MVINDMLSSPLSIYGGVPQGVVIGPLFFSYFTLTTLDQTLILKEI